MSNPKKAKGDAFEIAITNHLVEQGFDAKRTRAGYERDHGDIHVLDDQGRLALILQAKNFSGDASPWQRMSGIVADTQTQHEQSGARHAAAVIKRRLVSDPGKQYVVLELDWFLGLLRAAGLAAEGLEEAS